jgi:hypothetical protein
MTAACDCLDVMHRRCKMGVRDENIPANGKIGHPSGKSQIIVPSISAARKILETLKRGKFPWKETCFRP